MTEASTSPTLQRLQRGRALAGRHVLVIVENLPVPFDRRVWQECRALTAAGAVVSVICPTGKGHERRFETIDGIEIHRHPLPVDARGPLGYLIEYSTALFHETRLAWRVFRGRGFDTIHACNPPDLLFLVALPFIALGRSFVFDHHDINPELFEAKFGRRGLFWRLVVLLERLTFRLADVVISTNDSYAAIARERGGKDPADVFVVRSAPDVDRLRFPEPADTWRRDHAHQIGYVGVMGDQEGLDLLLEAADELVHRRDRDVQFVLVGGGPALEDLRAQSVALDLQDHVTFTGRVPDDVLFDVLSSSDVCVNPDRVNAMNDKSTMNKILEYMAYGKPIVQFDVTEGRVSAGDASLYARPNDPMDMATKIEELLDDPDRARAMGQRGRERLHADLSWDQQVDALVAAYRRAAEDGR